MKNRNQYIITLLMLLLSALATQGQSLDTLFAKARENNPQLKALRIEEKVWQSRKTQMTSLPDPEVGLTYFASPVETKLGPQQFSITAKQGLPWFGKLKSQGAVADAQKSVSQQKLQAQELSLYRDIKLAYYDGYYLQKAITVTEKQVALLQSLKAMAQNRVESGKGRMVDVLKVEIALDKLHTKVQQLKDELLPIKQHLRSLIFTDSVAIHFPDTLAFHPIHMMNMGQSLTSPQQQVLQESQKVWEQQKVVALKNSKPDFSIGATYINIGQSAGAMDANAGKDAWMAPQVGIKIPLFQKKYKAQEEEARLEAAKTAEHLANQQAQDEAKLSQLKTMYENALRDQQLYGQLKQKAQQSVKLLLTAFGSGELDFDEALRMEEDVLHYQLAEEKAFTQVQKTIAQYQYLTGTY